MSDVLPREFVFQEAQLLKAAFSTLAIVIRIHGVVGLGAVRDGRCVWIRPLPVPSEKQLRHSQRQPATRSRRVTYSQLIRGWRRAGEQTARRRPFIRRTPSSDSNFPRNQNLGKQPGQQSSPCTHRNNLRPLGLNNNRKVQT